MAGHESDTEGQLMPDPLLEDSSTTMPGVFASGQGVAVLMWRSIGVPSSHRIPFPHCPGLSSLPLEVPTSEPGESMDGQT